MPRGDSGVTGLVAAGPHGCRPEKGRGRIAVRKGGCKVGSFRCLWWPVTAWFMIRARFDMQLMRTLESVRLAVGLLTVLAIACLVGTLVPQEKSYALVYGAPWFLALLALLAVNLVCCTVSRRRTWRHRPGSVIMHASILLVVAGALVDGIWGVRGTMTLHIGEAGSEFVTNRGKQTLPFTVRLTDFVVEHYAPKLTVAAYRPNEQEPLATVDAAVNRVLSLGKGVGDLRVLQVKESVTPKVRVAPAAESGPLAIEFAFSEADRTIREDVLVEGNAETVSTPDKKLQLILRSFHDTGERDRELVNLQPPGTAIGVIQLGAADAATRVDVEVGKTHALADGTTLKILQYVAHFALDQGEVRSLSDEPVNPAVQVEVKKAGQEGAKSWLFAKFPDFGAMHGGAGQSAMVFVRPEFTDYAATVLVYAVHGGDATYAVLKPGVTQISRGEVKAGTTIEVGSGMAPVTVRRLLAHARVFNDVTDAKPGAGVPAVQLQLRVKGVASGEPLWIPGTRETSPLGDTGLDIGLFPQEPAIKEFRSTVQVLEANKVVKEQAVMVNHPLAHGGYSLYQSSYDREQERWSGLEVARSPGVSLVYAGFTLFVLGLLVTLYGRALINSFSATPGESAGKP